MFVNIYLEDMAIVINVIMHFHVQWKFKILIYQQI